MNVVCTESITPTVVYDPIVEPVRGTPARLLASAQGDVWMADGGVATITEHGEAFDQVDARGDSLANDLARILARITAMARIEGAVQTEAMAHEAVATVGRIRELDSHEDWHVAEMRGQAPGVRRHLRQTSQTIGTLLGQKDAADEQPWKGQNWTPGPNFPVHKTRDGAKAPRPHMQGPRTPGRWSRLYDACQECGRTDRKHAARGVCQGCYGKKGQQEAANVAR